MIPDEEPAETGCLKPVAILLLVLAAFVIIGSFVLVEHDNQVDDSCTASGCSP